MRVLMVETRTFTVQRSPGSLRNGLEQRLLLHSVHSEPAGHVQASHIPMHRQQSAAVRAGATQIPGRVKQMIQMTQQMLSTYCRLVPVQETVWA